MTKDSFFLCVSVTPWIIFKRLSACGCRCWFEGGVGSRNALIASCNALPVLFIAFVDLFKFLMHGFDGFLCLFRVGYFSVGVETLM